MASTLSLTLSLSNDQDDKQSCNRVQMMNETIRVPRDVSIRRVKRTVEGKKPKICGRLNDEMSTSKPKMQFCQKVERGIGIYIQELFLKKINIEQ